MAGDEPYRKIESDGKESQFPAGRNVFVSEDVKNWARRNLNLEVFTGLGKEDILEFGPSILINQVEHII